MTPIPTREEFDAQLRNYCFDHCKHSAALGNPIEYDGNCFVEKVMQANEPPPENPLIVGGHAICPDLAVLGVQVPISTNLGSFYADAVLHTPSKNTLIEYDGRAYHFAPEHQEADDARSAAILATGLVDQIVRFESSLVLNFPWHVGFIMSRIHKEGTGTFGFNLGDRLGMGGCREAWAAQKPSLTQPVAFHYEVVFRDEFGDETERMPFTVWIHRPTRQGDRVSRMLALLDHYHVRSRRELVALHRRHHPGADRN